MKVLRVVLVLLVSCVGACSIKGQVQGNLDVDGMKNLKSFKVVVENLTPEAEKIGITRDLVERERSPTCTEISHGSRSPT